MRHCGHANVILMYYGVKLAHLKSIYSFSRVYVGGPLRGKREALRPIPPQILSRFSSNKLDPQVELELTASTAFHPTATNTGPPSSHQPPSALKPKLEESWSMVGIIQSFFFIMTSRLVVRAEPLEGKNMYLYVLRLLAYVMWIVIHFFFLTSNTRFQVVTSRLLSKQPSYRKNRPKEGIKKTFKIKISLVNKSFVSFYSRASLATTECLPWLGQWFWTTAFLGRATAFSKELPLWHHSYSRKDYRMHIYFFIWLLSVLIVFFVSSFFVSFK